MKNFEDVKETVQEIDLIRKYLAENEQIDPSWLIKEIDLVPDTIDIEASTETLINQAIQNMISEIGRLLKIEENLRMKKLNITNKK